MHAESPASLLDLDALSNGGRLSDTPRLRVRPLGLFVQTEPSEQRAETKRDNSVI